jgi:hypothetical protein
MRAFSFRPLELYYIDEGETVGVDRNLLLGYTAGGEYCLETLSRKLVSFRRSTWASPDKIIERVKNCNRPGGSVDITIEKRRYPTGIQGGLRGPGPKDGIRKDDGEVSLSSSPTITAE